MNNLTYDELITIVVALDNEAARSYNDAGMLRDLKWKVFNLAVAKAGDQNKKVA